MSSMKLRDRIRAPTRYGEDDDKTARRSSLRPGNESSDEEWKEPVGSSISRHRKRKRVSVPYDPTLPPAAFPSLDRPQSGSTDQKPASDFNFPDSPEVSRANRARSLMVTLPLRRSVQSNTDSLVSDELEHVPINQLDNHLASNNMDNPTYARNVKLVCATRPSASSSSSGMRAHLDSDDDELPDAEQVLLEKVSALCILC